MTDRRIHKKNSEKNNEHLSNFENQTQKRFQRLNSIDFLKGFAIIIVAFYHLSHYWLSSDWVWVNCFSLIVMDVFGPGLFLFLTALAGTFNIYRKKGKIPDKVIRNRILTRGIVLMLMGIFVNLYLSQVWDFLYIDLPFPLNLWGYNILFFIGIFQIGSYIAYKLGPIISIFIAIIIIIFGPPFAELIYYLNIDMLNNQSFNIIYFLLHYFITSPIPQLPLFPWIAISFISNIFGKLLYDAWNKRTYDKLIRLCYVFLISGIVFILIGIFCDFNLYNPENLKAELYWYVRIINCANKQPVFPWKFYGIPAFLIRAMGANILFLSGVALLFLGIAFYFLDIRGKINTLVQAIMFYGKVSLSVFVFPFFFAFIYSNILPFWYTMIFYFVTTAFMGFLIYIWRKYLYAIGTPEWIVGKALILVQKYTYNRLEK